MCHTLHLLVTRSLLRWEDSEPAHVLNILDQIPSLFLKGAPIAHLNPSSKE
jgi:hypothetical protein